ncbi:P140CAP/SNIP-RELATED [Ceraceosorus bombacis]|uniref:p140CAP/SNIP-RELATED n=1 Tax=Ceraceosorus bombacis TaxID=401625 RepID=A0A0P1BRG9_9BASI|nr:P140CAP/SNIP-RELATED [Ceraceosorus bombacis]
MIPGISSVLRRDKRQGDSNNPTSPSASSPPFPASSSSSSITSHFSLTNQMPRTSSGTSTPSASVASSSRVSNQPGEEGSGVNRSGSRDPNHMESSTTRLLVATKKLLEALTLWSTGERSETYVSDVYVRLGNDFNNASAIYTRYGIDMSDLVSVPDDLRYCLEECLSAPGSQQALDQHLPRDAESGSSDATRRRSGARRPEALDPVERARLAAQAIGDEDAVEGAARDLDETSVRAQSAPEEERAPESAVRHSLVDTPTPKSSTDAALVQYQESAAQEGMTPSSSVTGNMSAQLSAPPSATSSRGPPSSARRAHAAAAAALEAEADPSLRALKSRDALERRASKRFSAYTFNKMGLGTPQSFGLGSLGMSALGAGSSPANSPLADRRVSSQRNASSATRRPNGSRAGSAVSGEASDYLSAGRAIPEPPHSPEALEELRSQRSSTETRTTSPGGANRLLAATAGDVAASSTESLPFVDAQGRVSPRIRDDADAVPPVPPLPTAEERRRLDAAQRRAENGTSISGTQRSSAVEASASTLSLFLQLGRQTRRAIVDLDPSASDRGLNVVKLRMLFMDRFSYSPGSEDFPVIYVKDLASGVSYELEDFADLQDGSLLTLNIEPLDQVKQHLDNSLSVITRELRDLKAAVFERDRVDALRRTSISYGPDALAAVAAAANAASQSPARITDSQFTSAGARVAQLKRANTLARANGTAKDEANGPVSPTLSSASVGSATLSGAKVATELKTQYDEVQSLRRELAVMRQIQGDFGSDVTALLKNLREQASHVRAIATKEAPAERNFIVAGKIKLENNSQEVLTLVEDLQDTVDDLKMDVINRGVKPKPATMKKLGDDMARANFGLEDLEKYVTTVEPSWRQTHSAELRNVMEEQEFLNFQTGMIADLREDFLAMKEVYENIQQVIKLRGVGRPAGAGKGGYLPPPPEEGHEGLNTVMLEVRGQSVDHEKRLKALANAERLRAKELASRTDDFQEELAGFVDGKALRKTGGHAEAERVRSKRDKQTLLAMFSGGADNVGGAPTSAGSTTSDAKPPSRLVLGKGKGVAESNDSLTRPDSVGSLATSATTDQ